MSTISRDLMRAVLEVRDRRHNETHAALLALFEALASELLEAGAIEAAPLADRVQRARAAIPPDAHGDAARHLLAHVGSWLRGMRPDLPTVAAERWRAPGLPLEAAEAETWVARSPPYAG